MNAAENIQIHRLQLFCVPMDPPFLTSSGDSKIVISLFGSHVAITIHLTPFQRRGPSIFRSRPFQAVLNVAFRLEARHFTTERHPRPAFAHLGISGMASVCRIPYNLRQALPAMPCQYKREPQTQDVATSLANARAPRILLDMWFAIS